MPVNDPPEIRYLTPSAVTYHDIPIDVLFDIFDPDNEWNDLVMAIVSDDQTVIPDGHIVVTQKSDPDRPGMGLVRMHIIPAAGMVTTTPVSITVSLRDPLGLKDEKTIMIVVLPESPEPVPNEEIQYTSQGAVSDENINVNLYFIDVDLPVDITSAFALTVADSTASNIINTDDCSLTLLEDGRVRLNYIPAPHAHGSVLLTLSLTDPGAGTETLVEVPITIRPVNDAPELTNTVTGATDDENRANSFSTSNIRSLSGKISAKDIFDAFLPEDAYECKTFGAYVASPLTQLPGHGKLTVLQDGTWEYTPDKGYVGQDDFYITVAELIGWNENPNPSLLTRDIIDATSDDGTPMLARMIHIVVNVFEYIEEIPDKDRSVDEEPDTGTDDGQKTDDDADKGDKNDDVRDNKDKDKKERSGNRNDNDNNGNTRESTNQNKQPASGIPAAVNDSDERVIHEPISPEYEDEDANGKEDLLEEIEDIIEEEIGISWALLNLILTILGLLLALLTLIVNMLPRRKREKINEAGITEITHRARKLITSIIATIFAIIGLIVFLITEDMSKPMQIVDFWTILMVIIFVIAAVFSFVALRKKEVTKDSSFLYPTDVG
jgi:hypothetical protein